MALEQDHIESQRQARLKMTDLRNDLVAANERRIAILEREQKATVKDLQAIIDQKDSEITIEREKRNYAEQLVTKVELEGREQDHRYETVFQENQRLKKELHELQE